MNYLAILLILVFCGCSTIVQQPSNKGMSYHYSGMSGFTCVKCKTENVYLFKLDRKNRVVCSECFKKSPKPYLYH